MARAVDKLLAHTADTGKIKAPVVASFREFLETQARAKIISGPAAGTYGPYTFTGREAMYAIVDCIDDVIGSHSGKPLKDSTIALAGGAQWGKTILELNLAAFITACRWMNIGTYLPDDKLAAEIVKAKFRPDVVDQIDWLAEVIETGKAVNKSGRSVHTDRVFQATDGQHAAIGMFLGLQKVPTSFSLDVVVRDEEDDIPRDKKKFLSGRLTASALRLQFIVGTCRVAGAGQHKIYEAGSQGVRYIGPRGSVIPASSLVKRHAASCVTVSAPPAGWLNPEDQWPQLCRIAMDGVPKPSDPQLTWEGDFKRPGNAETIATYTPDAVYYYAHPDTGVELDPQVVAWHHRQPKQLAQRNYTFRMAQIGTAAIDLAQIVAHWTRAVADSEEMNSFCCDRKAMPKSAAQALTPQILERARTIEPFDFGISPGGNLTRVGGLDMGDRCWLFTRECAAQHKRCLSVHSIAAGDVVARMQALFETLELNALLIDQRPLVNEARTLALVLNGLAALDDWPRLNGDPSAYVSLPGGLTWDGPRQQWRGLKCAVVRFDKKKLGAGIEQGLDFFEEGGQTKFVPVIACNRFESIDRVVREFLTPTENVIEVVQGKVRETPAMLLPRRTPGAPALLETLDAHLLTGSQREKDDKTGELGDYIDGVENHLLLADAYSRLAEIVGEFSLQASGPNLNPDRCATIGLRSHTFARRTIW